MTWTCQRQAAGVKCRTANPNRKQKCEGCGKKRGPRKQPAHRAALDLSYESYVLINGGEFCGICYQKPTGRRLDRDHSHATGEPRGLLCHRCNRALASWMETRWLEDAALYLARSRALWFRQRIAKAREEVDVK